MWVSVVKSVHSREKTSSDRDALGPRGGHVRGSRHWRNRWIDKISPAQKIISGKIRNCPKALPRIQTR